MYPKFDFQKLIRLVATFLVVFAVAVRVLMALVYITVTATIISVILGAFPTLPVPLAMVRVSASITACILYVFWAYVYNHQAIHARLQPVMAAVRRDRR